MARGELKVPFGLRDEVLFEPLQVERGKACNCVCPDPACNGLLKAVLPRASNIRPHFAHLNGGTHCAGVESAIHRMGKEVLEEGMLLHLPHYQKSVRAAGMARFQNAPNRVISQSFEPQTYSHVLLEKEVIPGIRPDAQITIDGWDKPLLIEIKVTRAVEDEKAEALSQAGYRTIEIDLSRLVNNPVIDRDAIRQQVHELAKRHWVVEPDLDLKLKKAQESLDKWLKDEHARDQKRSLASSSQSARIEVALQMDDLELAPAEMTPSNAPSLEQAYAKRWITETFPGIYPLLERYLIVPMPRHEPAFRVPKVYWQMHILKSLVNRFAINPEKMREEVSRVFGKKNGHVSRDQRRKPYQRSPQEKAVDQYLNWLWKAGLLLNDGNSKLMPVFYELETLGEWILWSIQNNHGQVFNNRNLMLFDFELLTKAREARIIQSAAGLYSKADQRGFVCAWCHIFVRLSQASGCPHCPNQEKLVPVKMTDTYLSYIKDKVRGKVDGAALMLMKAPEAR